jgi:hypothetical protein
MFVTRILTLQDARRAASRRAAATLEEGGGWPPPSHHDPFTRSSTATQSPVPIPKRGVADQDSPSAPGTWYWKKPMVRSAGVPSVPANVISPETPG